MSFGWRRRHTRSFESKWFRRRERGGGAKGRKTRTRRAEGRGRGAVGRVASLGTEKSGSGQTVLRVVGRIVSDPDSRELSQTAFSSETTLRSSSIPYSVLSLLVARRQCGPDG